MYNKNYYNNNRFTKNKNININQDELIEIKSEFTVLYNQTKLLINVFFLYLLIFIVSIFVNLSFLSLLFLIIIIGAIFIFSKTKREYRFFMNNIQQYYYDDTLAVKIKKKFKVLKSSFITLSFLMTITLAIGLCLKFSIFI